MVYVQLMPHRSCINEDKTELRRFSCNLRSIILTIMAFKPPAIASSPSGSAIIIIGEKPIALFAAESKVSS